MPLKRRNTFSLFLVVLLLAWSKSAVPAAEFTFGKQKITVPDGYTVDLAATLPLTERPIMGDFDSHGRLFIAEASGTNADVQTQLKERPHSILCLEDTNKDGVFNKRTVFADRMMLPAGVLCDGSDVYVAAPPSIWKLTDSNNDGVADQREEWFEGKTLTGCANDLHGPYLGRDGWIYWCKGAFAEQSYPRVEGESFVTRAAHIFRQRPEGSDVEAVMTGGMDNPVEVAFSPEGERFFTSTFVQHPGGGRRDGVLHAVYGGVYGKQHDVIDGHPRTSDQLMPVMTHVGNAAACALEWIDSPALGMQGNLLASQFNLRKITRHQLQPQGATFRTEDSDFLVSDSIDFHPTDIIEDTDGSLLIVDTGGWYKLCCPTSQLYKPDVPGAIYRVRKTEKETTPESRSDIADQQSAVWAQCHINSPTARAEVRKSLAPSTPAPVLIAALHSVSVWRDKEAQVDVLKNLKDPNAAVRRVAAEAIGRIGDATCVPDLLVAIGQAGDDKVLLHSLVFALIEIAAPEATREGLGSPDSVVRIAALTALDQMQPHSEIRASDVLPSLAADQSEESALAMRITEKHPEWSEQISTAILEGIATGWARNRLADFAHLQEIQDAISNWLNDGSDESLRKLALSTIGRVSFSPLPEVWLAAMLEQAKSGTLEEKTAAIAVLCRSELPDSESPIVDEVKQWLLAFAESDATDHSLGQRLQAVTTGLKTGSSISNRLVSLALEGLVSVDYRLRRQGQEILSSARLTVEQRAMVIPLLPKIPGLELTGVLPLLKPIASDTLGELANHPALPLIPKPLLKDFLSKLPDSSREKFERETNVFRADKVETEQLEEMLTSLPTGDVVRGQAVFNSSKAMCTLCHAIGYSGGKLGPDLTSIGKIRSRRDLLEAIMFPNASLVRSYESVIVTESDDEATETLGILRGDGAEEITLATGPDAEIKIPRSRIHSISPVQTSLMPAGLHHLLKPQELSDLITFLENTRWR